MGALVTALAMTGCLLPQDDTLLPVLPMRNEPPRFVTNAPTPPQFTSVSVGANCPTFLEFKIGVTDPDLGDSIRVRCFLDPNLTSTGQTFVEADSITVMDPAVPSQAKCKLPASFGTGLGVPTPSVPHIVEMLIADGELNGKEPRPDPSPNPDGGAPLEIPTYAVSFWWIVQTDTKECSL